MDDGDDPGASRDNSPDHDASHDEMIIEGLRPPLTREQRRRRAAVVAIVLIGALMVLLWPVISYQTFFSVFRPAPVATATGGGFTSRSQVQGGISIVIGSSGASGTPGTMCPVTPQAPSTLGMPEMHADIVGNGDVWALLLSGSKTSVNNAALIVWRATGSGAFQVVASGPGDARLLPVNGPDPHPGGSNWQRPGDEWQTNFIFPTPGCWQLQVTRGTDLHASIWLNIGA
ncbi:MAG TPA: hypothetical protein VJO13_12975 [Ktedonobacterales bacterium]|nr:hypothetical protein [Ktedonobacterales bacterium]